MFGWAYWVGTLLVLLLWGWILGSAGVDAREAWLWALVPLLFWLLVDWLASVPGFWRGAHERPVGAERLFCYLFTGSAMLPLIASLAGLAELSHFMPRTLAALLDLGGIAVLVVCLSIMMTGIFRLLGWTEALFGRPPYTSGGGAGPAGGGGG
ncbi:MAG: hypothetical protein LAT62_04170 [Natronospirillum sp.]|uniref:hypothetical protein n=1 Tax=Natronospirillum sp. TaxID=2812955 RepID=UPI0025E226B5|nr:hypothetical protein [Natronospirillum sp.]MCH8551109.1 hypothetical protein [Natronospirillum sp.]